MKNYIKFILLSLLVLSFDEAKAPITDVPVPPVVAPTLSSGINYKLRISQGSVFLGLSLILGSELTIRFLKLEKKELSEKEKKLLKKLQLAVVAGLGLVISGTIGCWMTSDLNNLTKVKLLLDASIMFNAIHNCFRLLFWLRG